MAVNRVDAAEFMALGLEQAGYKKWRRYKEKTNIERFRSHYGPLPKTCEDIWVDLQTVAEGDNRIDSNADPKLLLLACRFLWKYPTEPDLGVFFDMTETTVRKWRRIYVKKVMSLLRGKVSKLLSI